MQNNQQATNPMDMFKWGNNQSYAPVQKFDMNTSGVNVQTGVTGFSPSQNIAGFPLQQNAQGQTIPSFAANQQMVKPGGEGTTVGLPGKIGAWAPAAKMGVDVAQLGLGVFNAMQQQKMNKFMKSYYGDQMAMHKADFANAAKSTNQALENQQRSRESARGYAADSPEMQQKLAAYMGKWGVQEKY